MGDGDGYSSEQWDRIIAAVHRILATYPPYPGTKTWYVDTVAGSDTTGDGSEDFPYATATFCLTQASARDTIICWGTLLEDSIAPAIGQRLIGLGNGLTVLNKTTNTNPGIIVDNAGILVTGFIVDGGASTGHGIRIIDSNDCHIHNNTIRNITGAYDGIDKSSGGLITGADIHDNIIIDGAGAGIGLVNVTESKLKSNICLRNAADGIILNATCDNNVLQENICNENDHGIRLQGDNNEMVHNTMLNNTVANYVDSGTNNTRNDLQKKPEWALAGVIGMTTPAGLGVLTTAFTLAPGYPGRVALTLDIEQYVVADSAEIYVQQRVLGILWRNVGIIYIVAGLITMLTGPSASVFSPVAPAAATDLQAVQFDLHVDTLFGLRLQVNQSVGGGPRTLNWHYNYIMEV